MRGDRLVPLAVLAAVGAAFPLIPVRPLRPGIARVLRMLAVAPLFASGAIHVLRPAVFLPLIPLPFPRSAWFAVVTGIPELLGAAGLLLPRTRKPAAVCLAAYMVAIFPANIHVAGQTVGGLRMPSVPVRTAMQAAYMLLILFAGFGRSAHGTSGIRPGLGHS